MAFNSLETNMTMAVFHFQQNLYHVTEELVALMVYLNCIQFSPFIVHPLDHPNIILRLTVDDAKSFRCGNVRRRLRCIRVTLGHRSRRRPFITVMVLTQQTHTRTLTHTDANTTTFAFLLVHGFMVLAKCAPVNKGYLYG